MFINAIGYNPQCNGKNCKQSPSFGSIRFTQAGIELLKKQLINRCGENVDIFVKEIKPLIAHSEKNPIHVIVDKNTDAPDKLFAKVEDRKLKNFGFDASTTYPQDDKYSFDFIANASDKAEHLNKLNNALEDVPIG